MPKLELIYSAAGNTYPPFFIIGVGYIMYRFVYTETKTVVQGEKTSRVKWIAFFLTQVIMAIVAVGEWGQDTFLPTLIVVILEYVACYLARFFAIKSIGKNK